MDYINVNPNKPWSWYGISRNPNITMDYINVNPYKPWNWSDLSSLTFDTVGIDKYKKYLAAYRIPTMVAPD